MKKGSPYALQKMKTVWAFSFAFVAMINGLMGQTPLLDSLLGSCDYFDPFTQNAATYRLQIIYTQIDRDTSGSPVLKTFQYHPFPKLYSYPASLVKLPTCAVALEKINDLQHIGVNRFSRIEYGSGYRCQTPLKTDTVSPEGYPSIGNFIRKMLLVSDNESYSRTYEFCGQEYLNERLWDMGYDNVRIVQRFNLGCDSEANRFTNPFQLFGEKGDTLYSQDLTANPAKFRHPTGKAYAGKARMVNNKKKRGPRNYNASNHLPLADIHSILISLMLPEAVDSEKRFRLTDEDYTFLRSYMSMYPRNSGLPGYTLANQYTDTYKKYLLYGRSVDSLPDNPVGIHNIVGLSSGFASDCAYITDTLNHVEFFLSASIYANKSNVIGTGNYEYAGVAMPFMKELGKLIYEYELRRKNTSVHFPNSVNGPSK
jgi:hypothetical protein